MVRYFFPVILTHGTRFELSTCAQASPTLQRSHYKCTGSGGISSWAMAFILEYKNDSHNLVDKKR